MTAKLECEHCLRLINIDSYKEHTQNCDPNRIPVLYLISEGEKLTPKSGNTKTGVSCGINKCKGEIIMHVEITEKYPLMLRIKGPGGANQTKTDVTYFCNTCGVVIHFLPEEH